MKNTIFILFSFLTITALGIEPTNSDSDNDPASQLRFEQSGKTVTLKVPMPFCTDTQFKKNFDGTILVLNPLLAYNGACWPVGNLYGDLLTSKNGVCNLINMHAANTQSNLKHAVSMVALDKDGTYQTFEPDPDESDPAAVHTYDVFASILCK